MDPMTVLIEHDYPPQPLRNVTWPADTCRGSASLYAVRADLRGVYAFADVVEEAVRWSA